MDLNHGTRRNRFTVCRVWPLRYPSKKKMVPKTGIEPVTYWLQVSCSTNWAISAKNKWWAIQDSNLWPPACKADALTNWANRPSYVTSPHHIYNVATALTINNIPNYLFLVNYFFYILSIISFIFSLIHKSRCSFKGSNPFEYPSLLLIILPSFL